MTEGGRNGKLGTNKNLPVGVRRKTADHATINAAMKMVRVTVAQDGARMVRSPVLPISKSER